MVAIFPPDEAWLQKLTRLRQKEYTSKIVLEQGVIELSADGYASTPFFRQTEQVAYQ